MSPDDTTNEGGQVARTNGASEGAVEGVVALPRDVKSLEDLIERRRASLAATVDELVVRARPKEITRRAAAGAKSRLQAFATTEDGDLRTERLAAVAGTAVAFVGLLLLRRSRRGRSR